LHQVGTSSLLIYMMHGHTYIKYVTKFRDSIQLGV